ncbi:MAG: cytochrome C [Thalassobius sp.]|nr:cytochrome C [Thalassovita sp.]
MGKKIGIVIVAILVIIQFFRPEKNDSDVQTASVATKYQLPDDVDQILSVACYDCHSNKTKYPWYANIQPVGWWLNGHINDGKRHLNFSEFTNAPIAIQNHKFEETAEVIEHNEMPLDSYTAMGFHKEANLTEEQKTTLINWAQSQMDFLEANYPADSLKMPRRAGGPPPKD